MKKGAVKTSEWKDKVVKISLEQTKLYSPTLKRAVEESRDLYVIESSFHTWKIFWNKEKNSETEQNWHKNTIG